MNKGLQELIKTSQYYGKNPLYVIAGGGNTSYKDADKLWIKASGTSLAVIEEDGFVCLSREELKKIAEKSYSADSTKREEEVKADLHNAILYPKDKRPSVETSMHEIIDYPFVIHTHPTLVNALMCSTNAKAKCEELFGDDALFIEYTDPGYILFKKVHEEILKYTAKKSQAPKVIFLENHGVFVAGNTTAEVDELYIEMDQILRKQVKVELPDFSQNEGLESMVAKVKAGFPNGADMVVKGFSNDLITHFVDSQSAFSKVDTAYTPDGIVYCKAFYPFVEEGDDVAAVISGFIAEKGYAPKVIAVKGQGIVGIEDSVKSVNTVFEVYVDMLKIGFYAENFGGPKAMTAEQIAFIDNWEVENYRRKMAKS